MKDKDRRNEIRHKIWAEAAVYTKEEFYASAVATEISAQGIRIETAKAILPETHVVILMHVFQEEIEIRGIVQWTLSQPRKGINIYQMGVKTNAIFFQDVKAMDASERSEVVHDILYKIKINQKSPNNCLLGQC